MNYEKIAQKYIDSGYWIVPTKNDKTPAIKTWGEVPIPASEFTDCYGIGIICGLSCGIEVIDIDNHFNDAPQNFSAFLELPEVDRLTKKYKFPIQATQGGGYHFMFRCEYNEGNKKLAWRVNDSGRPEALFETKGVKGYFIVEPTNGYTVLSGDIFDIPLITPEERKILLNSAISFNEFIRPTDIKKTEYEKITQTDSERPGDIYNNDNKSIAEAKFILEQNGWKEIRTNKWCRPGKDDGVSATFGIVADSVFYVFSSNAYPFEPMKAYTPFQILALLRFNGDFSAAAKSLVPETPLKQKPKQEKKEELTDSEIDSILEKSRVDTNKTVDRPPTILSIKEVYADRLVYKRLFTLGNFSCITGKAKSKKTFLLTLLTATVIKNSENGELMGTLPSGKENVVYFDTEQGEYDSYTTMRRIEQISGKKKNFTGYNLRPYTVDTRRKIIEHYFLKYGKSTGLCVIDGIADLSKTINDEEEATDLTSMMLRLTADYACHISIIIHQNKNDNYATGHLGSSIMKKAEIVIDTEKNYEKKYITDVTCGYARGEDFEPFSIMIDDKGIPTICEYISGDKKPLFGNKKEKQPPY